jgi:phage/plasmid-associated DNA primase
MGQTNRCTHAAGNVNPLKAKKFRNDILCRALPKWHRFLEAKEVAGVKGWFDLRAAQKRMPMKKGVLYHERQW